MKGPILVIDAFEESQQGLALGLGKLGFQTMVARTPGDSSLAGASPAPKIAVVDVDGLDDAMIADMPEAVARHAGAPSSAANRSQNAWTVGLENRE